MAGITDQQLERRELRLVLDDGLKADLLTRCLLEADADAVDLERAPHHLRAALLAVDDLVRVPSGM